MEINIRKIIKKDVKKIFNLRNDKLTRKFSKNHEKIALSEHKEWFKNAIKSKEDFFYVVLLNKRVVGYIRYEKYNLFYKISIALNKNIRKKNHSKTIIDLSEKQINKNIVSIAEVKSNNKNAIKTFIKSRYKIINNSKKFITFCKITDSYKEINDNIFSIIERIKNVRSNNNINWMDILKIAFKNDPIETSLIFKKIQSSDARITKLSKQLN
jgi:hypothetical protein